MTRKFFFYIYENFPTVLIVRELYVYEYWINYFINNE